MSGPSPDPGLPPGVPVPLRDGAYQAVLAEWIAGRTANDPKYPPLERELQRLARVARSRGVDVVDVIRTLNVIAGISPPGMGSLDWDHDRSWAGRTVIRAYFRDD